jgi:hypothetical protein
LHHVYLLYSCYRRSNRLGFFLAAIFRAGLLIVDEAFPLKEVLLATFLALVVGCHLRLVRVVLDVDLLVFLISDHVLLKSVDQSDQLRPFDLLWVEVVCFGYIQVRHEVFGGFLQEKAFLNRDLMEVLLVGMLLKVVNNRQGGWVVLQEQFCWH